MIIVLSDNGYSFGEHRWEGKTCPYEACVRIPLAVYSPWTHAAVDEDIVSMVDVAPTIVDLAGAAPPFPTDGTSFASAIGAGSDLPPRMRLPAAFLEWAGDDRIPAWTAIRTADFKLIRYADGFEELYDLGGRLGTADPWETTNRAADPRYAGVLVRLRGLLGRVLSPG